ncbi:MAG: endolytic transglycosylase MltG [Oscillospiraceae bacterium]|nr:endolytic transglycosylase MltG [Oscillospiraceae bacterium]
MPDKNLLDDILNEYDSKSSSVSPDEDMSSFFEEQATAADAELSDAYTYDAPGQQEQEDTAGDPAGYEQVYGGDDGYTADEPAAEDVQEEDEEDIRVFEPAAVSLSKAGDEGQEEASFPDSVPEDDDDYSDDRGLFDRDRYYEKNSSGLSGNAPDDVADDDDSGYDGDEDGYDDGYDEDGYDEEYDDGYDDDGYDEEYVPAHHRKKSNGAGRLIFALIMVTIVISIALIGSAAVISASTEILALERSGTSRTVEIPQGYGSREVAELLQSNGIIGNAELFRLFSRINSQDSTFQAGEHTLAPSMTYGDIIEELQKKIVVEERESVTLTFKEGIRLVDAAKMIEEAGVCDAKDFIAAFNSSKFGFGFESKIGSNPMKFYKMEGYLFPDTYEFYLDDDPQNVVKRIYRNFDAKITPDLYGRMDDMGYSLDEVITLASIVQKEAGDELNMKIVASVFINRLDNQNKFPKLQSDPTSSYSEDVVAPNMEVYSATICDAYDTYKGEGLPPGAICNPGIEAINAVLYPRDTSYYYFCSDLDTGEFYYAETLSEHESNLRKAGLR